MRPRLLLLVLLCSALRLTAAEGPASLAQAHALATARDQRILLVFTDPAHCPPCQRFEREILSRDAFVAYAEEELVVMELPCSLPRQRAVKDTHEALRQLLGVEAYPTWWLLDTDLTPLLHGGYLRGGPAALLDLIDRPMRDVAAAQAQAGAFLRRYVEESR
ncbi:MAG: thioredoxin fold domain-containing protein [Opitutales bacterium]